MKKIRNWLKLTGIICISTFALFLNKATSASKNKVIIFHAGSLTVPFAKIEKEFEAKNPDIDIIREVSGSVRCARKITELKKPCDIIASADYEVIDHFLIPEYADWKIMFATNQIVLSYTSKSIYANEINEKNWYEILLKKDVVWGRGDPNLDPCGYRSLMTIQLAENYYKKKGLYKTLLNHSKKNIRPKAEELISLLQTGNMDYAFEYQSVAIQHGLKFLELPEEINLGDYKKNNLYSKAKVKVAGKKPGTFIEFEGKACIYGITILKNSPNKEAAIAFIKYLLDSEGGLKILASLGHPPIIPSLVQNEETLKILPEELKKFVLPGELI
jgi:molybdate/tungstate transport system substrate-binding protein